MKDTIESTGTTRLRASLQGDTQYKKSGTNYFFTWLTRCAYYRQLQLPPPI